MGLSRGPTATSLVMIRHEWPDGTPTGIPPLFHLVATSFYLIGNEGGTSEHFHGTKLKINNGHATCDLRHHSSCGKHPHDPDLLDTGKLD